MQQFNFNPTTGFNNTTSFPDPADETETREQLQRLHDQTRDFINNYIVVALNNLGSPIKSEDIKRMRVSRDESGLIVQYSLETSGNQWYTISGGSGGGGTQLPSGGTMNYVLAKRSGEDYAYKYVDVNTLITGVNAMAVTQIDARRFISLSQLNALFENPSGTALRTYTKGETDDLIDEVAESVSELQSGKQDAIASGTSLPTEVVDGQIFLLYTE